jgi:hypothetical protein
MQLIVELIIFTSFAHNQRNSGKLRVYSFVLHGTFINYKIYFYTAIAFWTTAITAMEWAQA